jgi:uncharacterized protein (TIGR02001 family)
MIKRGRAIKTLTASILGGAMLAAVSAPASAEGWGSGPPALSANVALTTDYVFRGISQTGNDPALQGGFDASWGWWYGGVWGSNVDFGAADPYNADLEIDLYTGIKPTWKNITFDLGAIFYTYPGVGDDGLDIVEGKAGVSTTLWESLGVGFTGYFADRGYQAYEFYGGYSFAQKWWMFAPSVSALIGFVETDGSYVAADYTYWNAGLTLGFWDKPNLSFDVRYWDTDNGTGCGQLCDARAVGTLKAAF